MPRFKPGFNQGVVRRHGAALYYRRNGGVVRFPPERRWNRTQLRAEFAVVRAINIFGEAVNLRFGAAGVPPDKRYFGELPVTDYILVTNVEVEIDVGRFICGLDALLVDENVETQNYCNDQRDDLYQVPPVFNLRGVRVDMMRRSVLIHGGAFS